MKGSYETLSSSDASAVGRIGRSRPQTSQKQLAKHPPDAVVRKLYHEVVLQRPIRIPRGEDKKILWTFLSNRLISKFDAAQACEDDYYRRHRDKDIKPEIEWLEAGLFSGFNEEGIPAAAVVERTEPAGSGTYRVYLLLTYRDTFDTYGRPPDSSNTFHWRVCAIVTLEDARYVVDDILFFEDEKGTVPKTVDSSLSRILTMGCDGSRWVGYGEQRDDLKKQR
jgi:hypothetical protein